MGLRGRRILTEEVAGGTTPWRRIGGVKVYLHIFLTSELNGCELSLTLRLLYPQGKSPWYSLYRRLVGSNSRSGRGGEEKNF
jgi:hypothetical protein